MKKIALFLLSVLTILALAFSFAACDDSSDSGSGDTGSGSSSEQLEEYTVTFVGMNGETLKTQTVKSGEAATAPEAPEVQGYRFEKWDASFENITENLTITAVYTDIEAPVLTMEGATDGFYDAGKIELGKAFNLPKVTATDNKDGNITENIYAMPEISGPVVEDVSRTADGLVVKFLSYVAGEFQVIFKVFDEAGNPSEALTVKVALDPATQDTVIPEGANDLANLNTKGKTFIENFEKGYKNVLTGGETDNVFAKYDSTTDAISGTSLVLDYSTGMGKIIYFGSVSNYINKYGLYKVKFTGKLIKGNPDKRFYVSLRPADGHFSMDRQLDLDAYIKSQGSNTISYEGYFNYTTEGETALNLAFFSMDPDVNMTFAIDDFEITAYDPVVGIDEEIIQNGSKTWVQSVNPLIVENGTVIDTPAELQGKAGFSDKVVHIKSTGPQFIGMNGAFKAGYTYVISFNYYMIANEGNRLYMGFKGGDATGFETMPSLKNATGLHEYYSYAFTAKIGDENFGTARNELSNYTANKNVEYYLGDVTIELLDVNYSANKTVEGEVSWDQNEYVMNVSWSKWIDKPAELNDLQGFGDKVLYLDNTNVNNDSFKFNGTYGLFKTTQKYRISFDYYIIEAEGYEFSGFGGSGSTGFKAMPELSSAKGAHTYTGEFTALEGDLSYMIYMANHPLKMYLGNFKITELANVGYDGSVRGTYSWDQNNFIMDVTNSERVDKPDVLKDEEGYGNKVLYLDNTNAGNDSFTFKGTNGLFEAGQKYRITFNYYIVQAEGYEFSGFGGDGATGFNAMPELSSAVGAHVYSAEFTAVEADKEYMIFMMSHPIKMYLGNFKIIEVEEVIDIGEANYAYDDSTPGSYVWDQNDYVMKVNHSERIGKPKELKGLDGYGNIVLYLDNTNANNDSFNFAGTKGLFTAGKKYRITFNYYIIQAEGWEFSGFAGADATGFEVMPELSKAKGAHTYTGEFTAVAADEEYMIFMAEHPLKMYLGNFTIVEVEDANYAYDDSVEGTYSWNQDGYVMDVTNSVKVSKTEVLNDLEGFGDKVLYLDNTKAENDSFKFTGTRGLFEAGKKYRITFTYYIVQAEGWEYSGFADSATGFTSMPELSKEKGVHTYSAEFTALETDKEYMIYMAGHPLKMYLGNFSIIEVAE